MEKRTILVIALIILALVIIFSFYSLTGNVLVTNKVCIDSDDVEKIGHPSEESFFVQGTVEGTYKSYTDRCRGGEHQLREFYCTTDLSGNPKVESWVETCKNGCVQGEGVCAR